MTRLHDLSVIILAHRDTAGLRAAVQSALPAGEVLVVWCSKSNAPSFTDLPRSSQVRVEVLPPLKNFAQARNQAMELSTLPWVFFLDSDETVRPNAWTAIERYIALPEIHGVLVRRVDHFLGKTLHWGEVGNAYLLRIFRRQAGHFSRAVHEVAEVKGKVVRSDVVIDHTPHESLSSFWQKITLYTAQEARLRHQNSEHFHLLQLLFYPLGKFLQNFVLRRGFLDGWRGLVYAVLMSVHSAAVRILQYERQYEK